MSDFNQQIFHDACCQGERSWMKDQGLGATLEIERLREVNRNLCEAYRNLCHEVADMYEVMSDESVLAICKQQGVDPKAVAAETRAVLLAALSPPEKVKL